MTETIEHISGPAHRDTAPDPEWVRGTCPICSAPVVSNAYYVGGKGYLIAWECWHALGPVDQQTCDYRRLL